MRLVLYRFHNLGGDDGVGILRKIGQTVFRAGNSLTGQLVGLSAGAETVLLKYLERGIGGQYAYIENARLDDLVMRVVGLVYGNGDALGGIGHLLHGVDDAAVVLGAVLCGQYEQTVGELEHSGLFHLLLPGIRIGLCLGHQVVSDGVGKSDELLTLISLDGGADGNGIGNKVDVLEGFQRLLHQAAGSGCPRAVFDQGNGAVLQVVRHDVVHHGLHLQENARVVGGGGEDQVRAAEGFGDDHRRIGGGNIVHHDVLDALVVKAGGEDLRSVLGVAVNGTVGDHHGLVFGRVGGPALVLFDEPAKVLAPDGSVQRSNDLNLDAGGLLQQRLHLRAVLADDVGVVAAGIVQPFALKIIFIGKQTAAQRAESAEGICGEEDLVRCIVGHHGLGPVHHGRHDKGKGVSAGAERVAFADNLHADIGREIKELTDHGLRLLVADDGHIGIAQHQLAQRCRMVGLHVIDHNIVKLAAGKHMLKIFEENAVHSLIHGIHQRGLFIQNHIGIIGNAAGDGEHVFKQRQATVVAAYPDDIFVDLLDVIHSNASSCKSVVCCWLYYNPLLHVCNRHLVKNIAALMLCSGGCMTTVYRYQKQKCRN